MKKVILNIIMKIKELIQKSAKLPLECVEFYSFAENILQDYHIFNFNFPEWNFEIDGNNGKLNFCWIKKWRCTDTYVGCRVYFFEGKAVAISTQQGRKSDENFEWISEEDFRNVREYLLSFVIEDLGINIVDMEENVDNEWIDEKVLNLK